MSRPFLLTVDALLVALVIALFGIFPADQVVIVAYLSTILYLVVTKRTNLFLHFTVASAMAAIWAFLGRSEYGYNQPFLVVDGINLFALFGWAAGLFASYLLFSHEEHVFRLKGFARQLGLFVAIYWPLLIAAETVAYHVFDIHNLAARAYPGLPLCDCLHAPRWMQALYFAMGPAFFAICWSLRLERPSRRGKKSRLPSFSRRG